MKEEEVKKTSYIEGEKAWQDALTTPVRRA
jgi:hypothetical protein